MLFQDIPSVTPSGGVFVCAVNSRDLARNCCGAKQRDFFPSVVPNFPIFGLSSRPRDHRCTCATCDKERIHGARQCRLPSSGASNISTADDFCACASTASPSSAVRNVFAEAVYTYTESEIKRNAGNPDLVGNEEPTAVKHYASLTLGLALGCQHDRDPPRRLVC
jgi:hypothetical protein